MFILKFTATFPLKNRFYVEAIRRIPPSGTKLGIPLTDLKDKVATKETASLATLKSPTTSRCKKFAIFQGFADAKLTE